MWKQNFDSTSLCRSFSLRLFHFLTPSSYYQQLAISSSIIAKSHREARSREIIPRLVIVRIFDEVPQVSARSERKRGVYDVGGCWRRWRRRRRQRRRRWLSMEVVELGKEGSKEKSEGEKGRKSGECWRQLPRCCRINFGGPQTQTVSVDSIERFYRCSCLLSVYVAPSYSHLPRSIRVSPEDQFSPSAFVHSLLRSFVRPSCSSLLVHFPSPPLFTLSFCPDRNIISHSTTHSVSTNSFVICLRFIIISGCERAVSFGNYDDDNNASFLPFEPTFLFKNI